RRDPESAHRRRGERRVDRAGAGQLSVAHQRAVPLAPIDLRVGGLCVCFGLPCNASARACTSEANAPHLGARQEECMTRAATMTAFRPQRTIGSTFLYRFEAG